MSIVRVENVRMAGLASSVPDFVRTVDDDVERFQSEDFRKIGESIGVTSRRIAPDGVCSSDLCVAAAERLLDELAWDRESIQAVSVRDADSRFPSTGNCMHACSLRLGIVDELRGDGYQSWMFGLRLRARDCRPICDRGWLAARKMADVFCCLSETRSRTLCRRTIELRRRSLEMPVLQQLLSFRHRLSRLCFRWGRTDEVLTI